MGASLASVVCIATGLVLAVVPGTIVARALILVQTDRPPIILMEPVRANDVSGRLTVRNDAHRQSGMAIARERMAHRSRVRLGLEVRGLEAATWSGRVDRQRSRAVTTPRATLRMSQERALRNASRINPFLRRAAVPTGQVAPPPSTYDPISHNVDAILAFYRCEELKIKRSQRRGEHISAFLGRPIILASVLMIVAVWIVANLLTARFGRPAPDSPPFFWLQGAVTLAVLLTSMVVLIKQNRMGKLERQRAHLDLQVNLLTEQKVTKLIELIEELRRDLPMVRNREDSVAAALQQPTDASTVLSTIEEWNEADAIAERVADAPTLRLSAVTLEG